MVEPPLYKCLAQDEFTGLIHELAKNDTCWKFFLSDNLGEYKMDFKIIDWALAINECDVLATVGYLLKKWGSYDDNTIPLFVFICLQDKDLVNVLINFADHYPNSY